MATVKCESCGKLVRDEGAMAYNTLTGTYFWHQVCPEPEVVTKFKLAEAAAFKAVDAPKTKPVTKPTQRVKKEKTMPTNKNEKTNVETISNKKPASKASAFVNPFGEGSLIAKAWDLAVKGTTAEKLEAFCSKNGCKTPARVRRHMTAGEFKGTKWAVTFNKETGALKISPKVASKSKKAA